MRIKRLKLKNFASIYAGMSLKEIDIDFTKCQNDITLLVGKNGSGKTSILSNLHPFPYLGNLDLRNSQSLIIEGNFDRILLRPKSIIVQILTTEIAWIRISKTIQALIIMIIALVNLKITLTFAKILTLIMMLISSVVIFFGIFLLMAAYCFYTVKGLEIRNMFTDGGKHVAQYPIGIFKKGFVFIFTFIIPYACVNYYPLLYFLGKSNSKLYMFSPLLVIIYSIFPFLIFKKGLKRYASTGS